MSFTDIVALAWRNLRQAKLRTALTTLGVVIGVAAIITMVSFGIGLQENIIVKAFSKLDLFTLITVFGPSADEMIANAGADSVSGPRPETADSNQNSTRRRVLDDQAIAEIKALSGVRYALPVLVFQSYVQFRNRIERHRITGALPSPDYNPRFKKFLAGHTFGGNDTPEVVVTERFLTRFGERGRRRGQRQPSGGGPFEAAPTATDKERAATAEQAIGTEVVLITLRGSSPEASSVFGIPIFGREAAGGEADDVANDPRFARHSFRIVGVLPSEGGIDINRLTDTDMYVPVDQARRFREANRDPLEQMGEALAGEIGYQRAEVRAADPTLVPALQQQIRKIGFNSFSLANQVEEIRFVFLVVDGGLALLGGIALLVASFGIANTMIMSILERTREIGIMKAIGGSDSEIMRIFFFEASLIGLAGGALGVAAGWLTDRVANFAVNRWVVKQTPAISFFSIPWWLALGAIGFAIGVSLLAAIYPAFRAARVDPIKALRHD
jgi:ABC-type antimicrobial peptide transport system permease subunit